MSNMESVLVPKKELPSSLVKTGWILTLVGLALVAAAYAVNPQRALFNNLIGFAFLMSVGVGGLFFIALEYITGAVWSTPFRRVVEFLAALLPLSLLFAIPLLMNMHDLFHWMHTEAVDSDAVLKHKEPYLNMQFFIIRFAVITGIWLLFYYLFRRNSLKQDTDRDQERTRANIKLAAIFLPIFAISISVFAID